MEDRGRAPHTASAAQRDARGPGRSPPVYRPPPQPRQDRWMFVSSPSHDRRQDVGVCSMTRYGIISFLITLEAKQHSVWNIAM